MRGVLFVCLGNICRSPMAEAVFRRKAGPAGLSDLRIDSAGTYGGHAGDPPDGRAVSAAWARGYDMSTLRSRQIRPEDLDRFDLIVVMDDDNHSSVTRMARQADSRVAIKRMMEYSGKFQRKSREVPDPYFGGRAGFERALDMIEDAVDGLIAELGAGR